MLFKNAGRIIAPLILLMFFVILGVGSSLKEDTTGLWSDMMNIIAVIFGVGGGALAIFPLIMLVIGLYYYLKASPDEYQNQILADTPGLPSELLVWETELITLGLSPIGYYYSKNKTDKNKDYKVWAYLDEGKTSVAHLVAKNDGGRYVKFSAEYADKFILTSYYNLEIEADGKLGSSRYMMSSISNTYSYHSSQMAFFALHHGQLKSYKGIKDVLQSPEDNLKYEISLMMGLMRKVSSVLLGYLSYVLLALSPFVLVPALGEYIAAWVFFPLAAVVVWFVDIGAIQTIFQSVEERNPRKANS